MGHAACWRRSAWRRCDPRSRPQVNTVLTFLATRAPAGQAIVVCESPGEGLTWLPAHRHHFEPRSRDFLCDRHPGVEREPVRRHRGRPASEEEVELEPTSDSRWGAGGSPAWRARFQAAEPTRCPRTRPGAGPPMFQGVRYSLEAQGRSLPAADGKVVPPFTLTERLGTRRR